MTILIIWIVVGIIFGFLGQASVKGFFFNFFLWPLIVAVMVTVLLAEILSIVLGFLVINLGLDVDKQEDLGSF